jgi:hypothetical protein
MSSNINAALVPSEITLRLAKIIFKGDCRVFVIVPGLANRFQQARKCIWHYSIPFTIRTITFVQNLTLRSLPFHSTAWALKFAISSARRWRSDIIAARLSLALVSDSLLGGCDSLESWSEGTGITIMNDSSVSICAERELRLVEPKSVSTGGDAAFGETQMPEGMLMSSFETIEKQQPTLCMIRPAFFFPFAQLDSSSGAVAGGGVPKTTSVCNRLHETLL